MAQEWYVLRGDAKHGPYTAARLKQLAADGRLKPGDRVQKDGMEKPVVASALKGLFPAPGEAVGRGTEPLVHPPPVPPATDGSHAAEPPDPPAEPGDKPTDAPESAPRRGALSSAWRYLRKLGGDLKRDMHRTDSQTELEKATLALGQRVYDVKVGDDAIRAQLAKLNRNIEAAKSANESTRKLEREKNNLLLKLGMAALNGDAPAGARAEHEKAREAWEALAAFDREWERIAPDPDLSPKWKSLPVPSKVVLLAGSR